MAAADAGAHADGIGGIPTHVGIRHEVDVRPHGSADSAYQVQVLAHALVARGGSVAEPLFHRTEALSNQFRGLPRQLLEVSVRIQAAGVDRNPLLGLPAQQVVERLARSLAANIPEGDIDGADGLQHQAFASIVERAAVHALPEQFHVEGAVSQHQRFQVLLDDERGGAAAHPHAADAIQPLVGADAHQHGEDGTAAKTRRAVLAAGPAGSADVQRCAQEFPAGHEHGGFRRGDQKRLYVGDFHGRLYPYDCVRPIRFSTSSAASSVRARSAAE